MYKQQRNNCWQGIVYTILVVMTFTACQASQINPDKLATTVFKQEMLMEIPH